MRARGAALAVGLVTLVSAGEALAGAPVDGRAGLDRAGGAPLAGQTFRVIASIESVAAASAPFDFTVTITLGAGLELVRVSQEFNAPSCTQTGPQLVCRGSMIGGIVSQSYRLDLRARLAGTYRVSSLVAVEGTVDANPGDNAAELDVAVGEAPLVARLGATPSPPRSGRAFRATLSLTRAGTPVAPARVTCRATLGGARLAGRAQLLAGGGRCSWRLPASSRGKRLTAAITATVDGAPVSRRVSARVG